jgi:hypothetical protein
MGDRDRLERLIGIAGMLTVAGAGRHLGFDGGYLRRDFGRELQIGERHRGITAHHALDGRLVVVLRADSDFPVLTVPREHYRPVDGRCFAWLATVTKPRSC